MFFAKDRPLCFKPQSISRYDSPPGQSLGALPVGFRFPLWETTLFFRWNRYLPPSYSPLTSFGNSYSYTNSDTAPNRSCPPCSGAFSVTGRFSSFSLSAIIESVSRSAFGQFSMLLLVLACLPTLISGRLCPNWNMGQTIRDFALIYPSSVP